MEPHQVDTASDQIALTVMGDVQLGQRTLLAGYLNPYMGLSRTNLLEIKSAKGGRHAV